MSYHPEEENSEKRDNHSDGEEARHLNGMKESEPGSEEGAMPAAGDDYGFDDLAPDDTNPRTEPKIEEPDNGAMDDSVSSQHSEDEIQPPIVGSEDQTQPAPQSEPSDGMTEGVGEPSGEAGSDGELISEDATPASESDDEQTDPEEDEEPVEGGEEPEQGDEEPVESSEESSPEEEKSADLVDKTLDGIEEIVKSEEDVEASEAGKEGSVDELAHVIEAIVFASDEPLTANTIKSVLDAAHTFGRLNVDMISDRINALNNKYESEGSGFRIVEIANGYQFATRKEMAQWVSNLFKERSKRKLSTSALESLAIIAYKQPITKPEIESIRGVNVDYVLHNLLEKELVTVTGRAESVGRPLLYGTTQKFLKIFALKSLDDLPKLREIDEIIKEIKSKGAEESIQLEITALSDQAASEGKPETETRSED